MFRMIHITAIAACLALSLPATGGATDARMASDWAGIPEAEVRLIAGRAEGQGEMLGLQFVMAPKWKVYWRSPGDAGFPPRPDWTGSTGTTGMALEWPLPERFIFYGLETYGYHDEIILPVRIDRSGGPVRIELALFYAACAEICVPVTADLSLELPEGEWPENRHGKAIALALLSAPLSTEGSLVIETAIQKDDELHIRMRTPVTMQQPDLIVEGPLDTVFGSPECQSAGTGTQCIVPVTGTSDGTILAGQQLRLTLFGVGYAAETEITVSGR
jgi:suppressor for copper-sensitivity B